MRSATSVGARYKRAHLSAIRFEGMPAQDRRYGPFSARADPNHPKTSHNSVVRSILACSKEASKTGIRSPSGGTVNSGFRTGDVVSPACTGGVRKSLTDDDSDARMLSRADNCGFLSVIRHDEAALLTDPETFETFAVARVVSQPRVHGVDGSCLCSVKSTSRGVAAARSSLDGYGRRGPRAHRLLCTDGGSRTSRSPAHSACGRSTSTTSTVLRREYGTRSPTWSSCPSGWIRVERGRRRR